MISHTNDRFWKAFALLPQRVQQQAETVYGHYRYYQGLHFKCIHETNPSTLSGSASVIGR